MKSRIGYGLVGLSILSFAVSLTQSCYYTQSKAGPDSGPGWVVFLGGWTGFMMFEFAWAANIPLVLSWVFTIRQTSRTKRLVAATIAFVGMLSFFFRKKIVVDESGFEAPIIGFGAGYWLWLASGLLVLLASFFDTQKKEPTR